MVFSFRWLPVGSRLLGNRGAADGQLEPGRAFGSIAPRSGEYFDRPVNVDSCNDNVATRMIQVDEGLAAIQPGHAGIGRQRHGASGRAAIFGKVAIEIQGEVVC